MDTAKPTVAAASQSTGTLLLPSPEELGAEGLEKRLVEIFSVCLDTVAREEECASEAGSADLDTQPSLQEHDFAIGGDCPQESWFDADTVSIASQDSFEGAARTVAGCGIQFVTTKLEASMSSQKCNGGASDRETASTCSDVEFVVEDGGGQASEEMGLSVTFSSKACNMVETAVPLPGFEVIKEDVDSIDSLHMKSEKACIG